MTIVEKILLNTKKYNGQYVAIKNPEDNTIVGAGKTPQEALNEAIKNGFNNPFLVYVPHDDLIHIYDIN
jgi:hypothetical protein